MGPKPHPGESYLLGCAQFQTPIMVPKLRSSPLLFRPETKAVGTRNLACALQASHHLTGEPKTFATAVACWQVSQEPLYANAD